MSGSRDLVLAYSHRPALRLRGVVGFFDELGIEMCSTFVGTSYAP